MTISIRNMVQRLPQVLSRYAYAAIAGITLVGLVVLGIMTGWRDLLLTPDQRGAWAMHAGRYQAAAAAFADPVWHGAALFRAGTFKDAAQAFAGVDTAEAAYDQGNALVMLGQYENAVARYDRALALRPGWAEAEANRALAQIRAERLKTTGGDTGNTDSRPDEVVFDPNKPKTNEGKDTQTEGGTPMSDEAVRALWLRGVQTKPGDFLRAKFAYQLQNLSPAPNGGTP
ncbi:tetratricopeptide repeat protein [Microvirga puerhi]|uniref:Tetratricopeptide repeat protein n=1 Tax=Microvirga puerhi TaxID=2876078 RepID=A0ABS7VHZ8_9HYPH|nr:tetratricopeptide repeat protein [Microvirga puerhi]MBZ6074715.1 tetratricopeptide repeat protein [Microvirga puerhi]